MFYVIIPPLFLYFLPFCYPYISLHFKCFYYLFHLDKLTEFINTVRQHVTTCEKTTVLAENESKIQIEGETRRGLSLVLIVKCKGCGKTLELESKKVVGPKGIKRWECNLAAVWGQMATGGGHSRLCETGGILGVPTMSQKVSLKQRGSSGNGGSKN